MLLIATVRARVALASIFLAATALFAFMIPQNVAHAQDVPLGTQIVCFVFTNLDNIGPPIPLMTTQDCQATSTPAGTGTLKVIKIVSGTSTPASDFSIHVKLNGNDVSGSPQAGSASGTSYIGLAPATYAVSEIANAGTNLSDYTEAFSQNCPAGVVVLTAGGSVTCTITNTWINPGGGGGGDTTSDLSMTKTVDKTAPNMGDTVTYTLAVHNAGPAIAIGVSVTDQLPSGLTYGSSNGTGSYNNVTGVWTVGTIANNATSTLNIVATVNSGTGGSTITNSATASDSNGDNNPGNNTGTVGITVNSGGGGCDGSCGGGPTTSDIALTKTVDNATPDKGATITYTLTVSDTGADATGVVVHDALPAGVTFVATSSADTIGVYDAASGNWTIGVLSSTTSATLHITATVNSSDDYGTVITNGATVTAGDTSGNGTNDSPSVPVTVTNPNPGNGGGGCGSNCGGSGGGGGDGNGPIVGSYGGGGGSGPVFPQGQVLGAATSTNGLPPGCSALLSTYMRLGKKDNSSADVTKLQVFLNAYMKAGIPVTGYFGPMTDKWVRAFQAQNPTQVLRPWGLKDSTGFVYKTTQRWINLTYCKSLNIPLPMYLTPYMGQ